MTQRGSGTSRPGLPLSTRIAQAERLQWSVAVVVVLLILGQAWISSKLGLEPGWILPAAVALCAVGSWVAAVFAAVDTRRGWDRYFGLGLVGVLALGTVLGTMVFATRVFLGTTLSPPELELTGAVLWPLSVGVFGMAYWEADMGGPTERPRRLWDADEADFMFPQQQPDVVQDWTPSFGDYLYVSLTNATAFSPTDTMPMSHMAKFVMGMQSVTSATILLVLVARAVNIAK